MVLCFCLMWATAAWAEPVTVVQVVVQDSRGGTSIPLLQKMTESMQVVAQQLFLGKGTEKIAGDIPG